MVWRCPWRQSRHFHKIVDFADRHLFSPTSAEITEFSWFTRKCRLRSEWHLKTINIPKGILMFSRRERRMPRFQEKTGISWNFLKIRKVQENHRKRGNQRSSRKTENATWRKTGPRPGPAWGPLLVYNSPWTWQRLLLAVSVFAPIWISGGPGGPPNGAPFGPPRGPPRGPESQEIAKIAKIAIFMEFHEIHGNLQKMVEFHGISRKSPEFSKVGALFPHGSEHH